MRLGRRAKSEEKPLTHIEVFVGPDARIKGELESEGSIRIDGRYEGKITTPANVIVGESARVDADITARAVSVSGAVKGSIFADRVEILDGGKVWGDVEVKSFLLDDGGYIRGNVIIRTPKPVEEPFGEDVPQEEAPAS